MIVTLLSRCRHSTAEQFLLSFGGGLIRLYSQRREVCMTSIRYVCLAVVSFCCVAAAQTSQPADKIDSLIDKGLTYLKAQQKPDSSWQDTNDPPAITALALRAFSKHGDLQQPFVQRGFEKMLASQQPDGGIYNGMLANYNTAICVTALAAAGDEYKLQQDKAVAFLRGLQWTDAPGDTKERKQVQLTDPNFGGVGYGRSGRPDLSNLQMTLDALHDAGVQQSDPAFQNAIKFVYPFSELQRNQQPNLGRQ